MSALDGVDSLTTQDNGRSKLNFSDLFQGFSVSDWLSGPPNTEAAPVLPDLAIEGIDSQQSEPPSKLPALDGKKDSHGKLSSESGLQFHPEKGVSEGAKKNFRIGEAESAGESVNAELDDVSVPSKNYTEAYRNAQLQKDNYNKPPRDEGIYKRHPSYEKPIPRRMEQSGEAAINAEAAQQSDEAQTQTGIDAELQEQSEENVNAEAGDMSAGDAQKEPLQKTIDELAKFIENGTLGSSAERRRLMDAFSNASKSDGPVGELDLLYALNKRLHADGSDLKVSLSFSPGPEGSSTGERMLQLRSGDTVLDAQEFAIRRKK